MRGTLEIGAACSQVLARHLREQHAVGQRGDDLYRLVLLRRVTRVVRPDQDVGVNGVRWRCPWTAAAGCR